MEAALLVSRLILAAVFLAAGSAKLADWKGSQRAAADFGLPAALAAPLGLLLPAAELAVGMALLSATAAWAGGVGALALLLTFIAGIAVNLARGRKPDCHCFGQIHSEPIGGPTLARNALLAALAGLVVSAGNGHTGPSALAWAGKMSLGGQVMLAAGGLLITVLALQWAFLLNLLRQNGRLLVRLESLEETVTQMGKASAMPVAHAEKPAPAKGLPVDAPAPAFSLSGLFGETLTLDSLRAGGRPVILIFSDPGCGPCGALLPDIARWQAELAGDLTLALVSRGSVEANRKKIGESSVSPVLLQVDREVAEAYQCAGTPGAVLINPDGTIASGLAMGADAIKALVVKTAGAPSAHAANGLIRPGDANGQNGHGSNGAARPAPVSRPAVGQPAPVFTLPDLNDQAVSLADFRGSDAVLLFWNPGCSFCHKMLDDVKAWEAAGPAPGAPKLLVVSTGTLDANRAMGLHSPVVLDDSFRVGPSFGAGGTPMAVRVDAAGLVASDLAAGGPDVMGLLSAQAAAPQPLQN